MRRWKLCCGVAVSAAMLGGPQGAEAQIGGEGGVVVANRSAGTISVIDVATSNVTTLNLPAAGATPEPMYVVYNQANDAVLIGDRANNRVVALDARDFTAITDIPTGSGVFHMSADEGIGQLWVNNDGDDTVTVANTNTFDVITTVTMPADLTALGGSPHDVVLDPSGPFAYIAMIGMMDNGSPVNDVVVKFSTDTFTEVDREEVGSGGASTHLSLSANHDRLYVMSQADDVVEVLDRATLSSQGTIAADNAHGEAHREDGSILYTANISDGGTNGLITIDTATNTVLDMDNTDFATPHNIALSPANDLLYVTHSGGTADQVSIFDVSDPTNPSLLNSVTTDLNPYGIGAVPAIPEPASATIAAVGGLMLIKRRRTRA